MVRLSRLVVVLAFLVAGCGNITVSSDAICTPGAVRCGAEDSQAVEQCNKKGSAFVFVEQCGRGKTCDAGKCVGGDDTDVVDPPADEGRPPADEGPAPTDEGPAPTDEGPPPADEGPAPTDEGPAPTDEGPPPVDDGPVPPDEGPPPPDEGPPPPDEGPPPPDEGCQPTCADGVNCGPDGCGGSCGACAVDQLCSVAGHCQAAGGGLECADPPSPPGGSCGEGTKDQCTCVGCLDDGTCSPEDDDCVCADCATDAYCAAASTCKDDGICQPYVEGCQCADCAGHPVCPVCTPDCETKECGPDGCGGVCGICPGTGSCVDGQCACVPACGDAECGSDGCGGTCGTCPLGEKCSGGQCKCFIEPCPDTCKQNKDCKTAQYCAKPLGACTAMGACATKPEICTLQYDPVCGCDGKTHGNACKAASAGVSIASKGACAATE